MDNGTLVDHALTGHISNLVTYISEHGTVDTQQQGPCLEASCRGLWRLIHEDTRSESPGSRRPRIIDSLLILFSRNKERGRTHIISIASWHACRSSRCLRRFLFNHRFRHDARRADIASAASLSVALRLIDLPKPAWEFVIIHFSLSCWGLAVM